MKKNLLKSSILFSTVLIFAACQKQAINPNENPASVAKEKSTETTRVKTRTMGQNTNTYAYDARKENFHLIIFNNRRIAFLK